MWNVRSWHTPSPPPLLLSAMKDVFGKWWAEEWKGMGSLLDFGTMLCLIPGHKFTWPLMTGEQVLFYFSGNLLEFMCYRSLLQAGWFLFLSFAFVCVKNVEYFNQYSYRNWCGLVLSDSRNSLSGQIWWWIHSYMHSGEGASASSLAWRRAWMQMGGLQTNLITSGFAWNWFPCKDTELLCASLMAFFSLLFSFFLFLFSLLLAMNTPRQMSIIFQVSVTFAELKGCSFRSAGGKLPRQVSSCFLLDITRSGLHSLWWKKRFIVAKITNFPLQRLHCVGQLKGCFLNENYIKNGCLYC